MAPADVRARKALLLSIGAALAVSAMAVTGVMLDNPGEVSLPETARSVAVLGAVATLGPLCLFAAGGAFRLLAYAFPLALFVFFKFVAFYFSAIAFNLNYSDAVLASVLAMAALSAAGIEPFRKRDPVKVASLILIVTASAAGASIASLSMEQFGGKSSSDAAIAAVSRRIPAAAAKLPAEELPDIIYIVPDRYGNAATLSRVFDADVGQFRDQLRARGFYYADDARSNYPKTFQSIASTFNMTDLAPMIGAMGPQSKDHKPIYKLLRENAAQRMLRSMGYSYIHLGSWWEPTRFNPDADQEYYGLDNWWSKLNEYEHALLRTTPLASLATFGGFVDREECARLKHQLDWLQDARKNSAATGEGPMFVFAHLTLPHDPITMDSDGKCIAHVYYLAGDAQWERYRAAYAGYVAYLNRRLVEIFDANKGARGGRGLIFVVQADEGPYPKRLLENGAMNLQDFTDDEIREKFGVTNAIYWDAEKYGAPYLTQTPINNWRIILSKITGDEIPLIEDERSMLFRDDAYVYDMKDVTDVFETSPPSAVAALN